MAATQCPNKTENGPPITQPRAHFPSQSPGLESDRTKDYFDLGSRIQGLLALGTARSSRASASGSSKHPASPTGAVIRSSSVCHTEDPVRGQVQSLHSRGSATQLAAVAGLLPRSGAVR